MRIVFELFVNLFQGYLFVMFCLRFLGGRFTKQKNTVIAMIVILAMFFSITIQNYITFFHFAFSELFLFGAIMMPYSIICLKGKLYLRILIPITAYVTLAGIGLAFECFCMAVFNVNWKNITEDNHFIRYFMTIAINLIFSLSLFLFLKFQKDKIKLSSISDIIVFIILPLMGLTVILLSFIVSTNPDLGTSGLYILAVISVITFLMIIIVLSVMVKVSKSSELKAQNIILQKEQQFYQNEIKNSDEFIREVATIKHDMKNKILCIEDLIKKEEYDEVLSICKMTNNSLSHIELLRTKNIYLNSILNVIRQKANENEIDLKIEVNSELSKINGNDLITIIGNLCDNSIEYLVKCPNKKMFIFLTEQGGYYIVTIKNSIKGSVLLTNPDLHTQKDNVKYHGYGLPSVKKCCKKYNGYLDFSENEKLFSAKVMLEIPNITK